MHGRMAWHWGGAPVCAATEFPSRLEREGGFAGPIHGEIGVKCLAFMGQNYLFRKRFSTRRAIEIGFWFRSYGEWTGRVGVCA